MISYLVGKIIDKQKDSLTLLTAGGVGYEVRMTAMASAKCLVGGELSIHTYLKVSDSALDVYGFENKSEKEFFTLLLTVSGVGPKTAMSVLNLGAIDKIQSGIARGDVKYLTAVSGLGKKTAERLVLELKTKVTSDKWQVASGGGDSDVMGEVIEALVSMGYSREDAKERVQSLTTDGKSTEKLLREALK